MDVDAHQLLEETMNEMRSSTLVCGSLSASIAACSPLLIDYIADFFEKTHNDMASSYIPHRELFIALIVPDLIFLLYCIPYGRIDYLFAILNFRDTLINYATASYLNTLCPETFTSMFRLVITLCMVISDILSSFSLHLSDPNVLYATSIINDIASWCGVVTVLLVYCRWHFFHRNSQDMRRHNVLKSCNIYASVYLIFCLVNFVSTLIPNSSNSEIWMIEYGVWTLSAYTILMTGCSITVVVMITRLAREEVLETKVVIHNQAYLIDRHFIINRS